MSDGRIVVEAIKSLGIKSVWDTGDDTIDRFLIVLEDGYHDPRTGKWLNHALGVSEEPTHWQRGFSQFTAVSLDIMQSEEIAFQDLPENVQSHVIERLTDEGE